MTDSPRHTRYPELQPRHEAQATRDRAAIRRKLREPVGSVLFAEWRRGVLLACLRVVDKQREVMGMTHNDLAIRYGVERSTVTKWFSKGAISSECFAALVTDADFRELAYPSPLDRSIDGYREVISFVRKELLADPSFKRRLDRDEFETLVQVHSSEELTKAELEPDPSLRKVMVKDALANIAARVNATAQNDDIEESAQAAQRDASWVDMIRKEWGRAYRFAILEMDGGPEF